MASFFRFSESYGASPTIAPAPYLHFLSVDEDSGGDATTQIQAHPIVIPASSYAYSYERALRGEWWSGTFSTITSLNFWKQSGTLTGTLKIKALKKASAPTVYQQVVTTASTIIGVGGNEANTTNDIPTATGTIQPAYASTFSDYIYMQLVVPAGSASGSIGTMTYRMGWNET